MKRTIKLASVLLLIAVISMTLTTMVSANSGIDAANIAGGLKGTTSNAPKINIAPTRYGIIVFLYSAFSEALPIMYLIPKTNSIITATTTPTVVIIPIN